MDTSIKIKRLLLALILLGFSLTLPSKTRQTITIGIPESFPPFYFLNAENQYEGVSYDIVSRMLIKLGYEIEVRQYDSLSKVLDEAKKGAIDLVVNLTATEEREEFLVFTSVPHVYETQDLITLKNNPFTYTGSLLSLSQYRVGVIYGWTHGEEFDKADFISKIYVRDAKSQLQGLLAGHFDLVVNNRHFFRELASNLGLAFVFKAFKPPMANLPVTVGVSKHYPKALALVKELDEELAELTKTDEYFEILKDSGLRQ